MKNNIRIRTLLPICAFLSLFFMGDTQQASLTILHPSQSSDSTSYDAGKIFLLSLAKDTTTTITASRQWQRVLYYDFRDTELRENFAKEFLKIFEAGSTIEKVQYTFKNLNRYTMPESVQFRYAENMTIRTFWGRGEFSRLLKSVQATKGGKLFLTVRGWVDSSYTTTFDDPLADNRGLYKIQMRLIPGLNTIYFAPGGDKNAALEYSTTLSLEQKSLDSRDHRFHATETEGNCTSCHEGLASADSGKSMTADCASCHKALAGGPKLHAPVEMKECGSCHTWSAESKVMAAAPNPDKCFECHTDKKEAIDSAAVQHAVATDCAACHSPHSSTEPHLLKTDVFNLCTSCHPAYTSNHPVGTHPMRFVKVGEGENVEEISCVSCHNPHGSNNPKLLTISGGKMAVCIQCHQ